MRMRAQQSFALKTLRQVAQPRIQRMRTQMWLIPRSRTFKFMMICSAAYLGMQGYWYYRKKYPSTSPSSGSFYSSDGYYYFFGKRFQSPKQTMIERLQKYMGNVIGEVLADEKVNEHGLNFLDRMFRHPQTHEAGQFLLINVLKDPRFIN